jgi:TPR repeat protein
MYNLGSLSNTELETAVWYEKAAEAGNVKAKVQLTLLLMEANELAWDRSRAASLLRQAAAAGDPCVELAQASSAGREQAQYAEQSSVKNCGLCAVVVGTSLW